MVVVDRGVKAFENAQSCVPAILVDDNMATQTTDILTNLTTQSKRTSPDLMAEPSNSK